MTFPPALMHVRISEKGRTKINLWLPLILLWPLMLLIVVLSPLAVVAIPRRYRPKTSSAWMVGVLLFEAFCSLRKLGVDLVDSDNAIRTAVY